MEFLGPNRSLRSKRFRAVYEQRTRNESKRPNEKWRKKKIGEEMGRKGDLPSSFPSPPPSFIFWLSFHFSRGQNRSLSLLRNQTETLATQASRIADISCGEQRGDTAVLAAYTNQCLLAHVASPGNLSACVT